jgi:hypothetical protein
MCVCVWGGGGGYDVLSTSFGLRWAPAHVGVALDQSNHARAQLCVALARAAAPGETVATLWAALTILLAVVVTIETRAIILATSPLAVARVVPVYDGRAGRVCRYVRGGSSGYVHPFATEHAGHLYHPVNHCKARQIGWRVLTCTRMCVCVCVCVCV